MGMMDDSFRKQRKKPLAFCSVVISLEQCAYFSPPFLSTQSTTSQ